MKYAIYKTSKPAFEKAGAAVCQYRRSRGGFTMMELMVVIVIIGILATLAYSNLMDVILTNRAKETAQTIRTFTEKALMDAKRQNAEVKITMSANKITALIGTSQTSEALGQGYSASPDSPGPEGLTTNFNTTGPTYKTRIGLSGIDGQGYFAACDFKEYCAAAAKLATENSFKAYIRKGKNADWEAL